MDEARIKKVILASSLYARLSLVTPTLYGTHKLNIEKEFMESPSLSPVILRLPPVYGVNGKGGIALLRKLIAKKIPLPLGAAIAKRDYISVVNVANLIKHLVNLDIQEWDKVCRNKFEPSDGISMSTVELCKAISSDLEVRLILLRVPYRLLAILAKIFGKKDVLSSAFSEMRVTDEPSLYKLCGWLPIEAPPKSLKFTS